MYLKNYKNYVFKNKQLIDQIIVCDNGSSDKTAEVARSAGAKIVTTAIRGYGLSCLKAITEVEQTDILLFVNADGSEKFLKIYY